MDLKARYNLWKVQKSLSPGSQFKAGLFKKLSAVWDSTYNVKYAWYQTVWFKHATGFASVVLMAGSLGTGAYAYSSPQVTEGNVLYPIKQNLEKIEEKTQTTPEAKAKFYLKQIQRREEEKTVLKKSGVEITKIEKVNQSIEQTEDQLEETDKITKKVSPEDIKLHEEVVSRLQARAEKRQEKLQKQAERLKNREEKLKNKIDEKLNNQENNSD